MKGYLFDTHVHTAESSACGEVAAEGVVARYRSLGYNGHGGHNSSNDIAYRWAEKYSLPMSSGSDFHRETGMEPGGVYFSEMPHDSFDVARMLKNGEYSLKCFTK